MNKLEEVKRLLAEVLKEKLDRRQEWEIKQALKHVEEAQR